MRTSSRERGNKICHKTERGGMIFWMYFHQSLIAFHPNEGEGKKGSLDKSMEPLESFLSGDGNCLKISHSNIVRTQKAHLADSLSPWKCHPPHYAQKQIDAVLHWKLPLHNQIHAFL